MMSTLMSSVESTLILSIAALYIVHCPFNKVEESFNTQAVHDIVNIFPNNLPSQQNHETLVKHLEASHHEIAVRSQLPWDHTQFPGVVPRTFIGALLVGLPMKFAKHIMTYGLIPTFDEIYNQDENDDEPDFTTQFILQIGSRFALSSLVVLSLTSVTRALQKRYGMGFRICFLLITISQFHYMFYAGRFLPNTFAAICANLVFASWINRQYSKSVVYIAICVVIFRFDTALFFGCLLFDAVFIRRFLPLSKVLKIGIPAGLLSMLATITIDSTFWARLVWPELEGFHFNVWLNKSHEWGTESYFWYVYSCIPRLMLASAPLILFAEHRITREYLIPTLAFIIAYSTLPHKELRFILFVTPLLNICATSGLLNIYYYLNKSLLFITRKESRSPKGIQKEKVTVKGQVRSRIALFIFITLFAGLCIANLFACLILSRVSSHNYPGGQAAVSLGTTKELLDAAQESIGNKTGLEDLRSNVGVYVDNLAAQTGLSRFVQVNGAFYSKTEKLNADTFRKSYKLLYLILEPTEINGFLKDHCPIDQNIDKIVNQGAEIWRRENDEIKCSLPNQPAMYCSIINSVSSFKSVNIAKILQRIKDLEPVQSVADAFEDEDFIRTRIALYIIRCSTRSKSNPF